MKGHNLRWLGAVTFTVVLLMLIAVSTIDPDTPFYPGLFAIVLIAVAAFYRLFPGSRFFSVAFANFLGVYACMFVFFMNTNFASIPGDIAGGGFILPILAFLVGSWWKRVEIRAIVTSERLRDERRTGRLFGWLIPVTTIGAISFLLPGLGFAQTGREVWFLASMAGIALVVFFASRYVCSFLLDAGLIFEQFFRRMSGLVLPAFAFFTFYSLVVIVFASIYRIIDIFSAAPNFIVDGLPQPISFVESLYFSVISLSTVGYGDIVPRTDLVRMIVSVEIVLGVVLLLFGFSEIISYRRQQRDNGKN